MDLCVDFGERKIVRLALGMSRVGSQSHWDEKLLSEKLSVIDELSQHGVVFLDTSPLYGAGFSEQVVGQVASKRRDRFFIATKYYPQANDRATSVIRSVERSLERLRTDYVDLLQMHWAEPKIHVQEILEGIEDLRKRGVVASFGLSGYSQTEMSSVLQANSSFKILSNQVELHLGNFNARDQWSHPSVDWTLAYSVLLQGRLTYSSEQLSILSALAREHQTSPASLAFSCIMAFGKNVIPILRISSKRHLLELLNTLLDPPRKIDFQPLLDAPTAMVMDVDPSQIKLKGDAFRKPYLSEREAIENSLDLIPSPLALSERFRKGEVRLPVLVSATGDGRFVVDHKDPMNEVKRYWAWRLARPNETIPVIVLPKISTKEGS